MEKIYNKDIAEHIGKSIDTINGWKKRQPELLELCKIGLLCKKYNINEDDLKRLIDIKQSFTTPSDTKLLN